MFYDTKNLRFINMEQLEKSITRKEAKSVHGNLPEGGVWRTVKGHHIYIKDGQVVAGAGVGKSGKPVKLTKKHLAEHQETVDKEKKKKAAPAKKASKVKAEPKKAAPAKKASKATESKKPKGFEDMSDEELDQAVTHHNDTYWNEHRKHKTELDSLHAGHRREMDGLKAESQEINKMRMSKKRTALREAHEKKHNEALQRHNAESAALRKKHDDELKPFEDARIGSAKAQGRRTAMKTAHASAMQFGGYQNVFKKIHEQMDTHHRTLNDGRSSEHAKEHAKNEIDRAQKRIKDFEDAAAIHGKGEKAPDYQVPKFAPKKASKPKAEKSKSHGIGNYHTVLGNGTFKHAPNGKKVDIHPDLHTFADKDTQGNHAIFEATSGMKMMAGNSHAEAVQKTKDAIQAHGIDKIQGLIKRAHAKNGKAPQYQDTIEKSLTEVRDAFRW